MKEEKLKTFKSIKNFEELVSEYFDRYMGLINPSNQDMKDYQIIRDNWFEEQKEIFNTLDDEIKDLIVNKVKQRVSDIEEYFDLADFRFKEILKGLQFLASTSEKKPVSFSFISEQDAEDENSPEYFKLVSKKESTIICIDFDTAYFKDFSQEVSNGKGYNSGAVNHIYHFFQPVEICLAVYANKEEDLLEGGPIIG